jgi:hypothetical protein
MGDETLVSLEQCIDSENKKFENKILKLIQRDGARKFLQVRINDFIYDNQDCKMIDF